MKELKEAEYWLESAKDLIKKEVANSEKYNVGDGDLYKSDEPDAFKYAWEGLSVGEQTNGDNNFKTIVNVIPDADALWFSRLDFWCKEAGSYIDILGIDHYPFTWSVPDGWSCLSLLLSKTNNPNDACYGKSAAVMETGYSTFLPNRIAVQSTFIKTSIALTLRWVVTYANTNLKYGVSIGCWYKSIDAIPNILKWEPGMIVESNFGIMYGWGGSDWTTKPGYADLKDAIGQY